MAINFPDSPTLNQTYTVGSVTWKWDGTTWTAVTISTHASTHLAGGADAVSVAKSQISDFAHTHATSDVTGLDTALGSKMPAMTANLGNGDFNSYITPGMYRFDVPTANSPGHSYGSLLVVRGGSSDTIGQTTWDYYTGATFTRSAYGIGGTAVWTPWKRIGMVTQSTADPSGGYDGDVWLKYTP